MSKSTKEKKIAHQDIGNTNADAVEKWLLTNPELPLYQGRANQAAIGRKFGITKSTWGSNPRLKALWKQLQTKAAQQFRDSGSHVNISAGQPEDIRKLLKEKDKLISWLRRELARTESKIEYLKQDSAAEELLILTGRFIRHDTLSQNSELAPNSPEPVFKGVD